MHWQPPFPIEELNVRAMCGDPAAQAYKDLTEFIQELEPKLGLPETINCIFLNQFGDKMSRYSILRKQHGLVIYIPEDMPEKLFEAVLVHLILENPHAIHAPKDA